jgi:hypothetical protein
MLRALQIEPALVHLAGRGGKLCKNNVQTNAYDQNRPAAHRGFYLALNRSLVSSSPIPPKPSPKCDQTKNRSSNPSETFTLLLANIFHAARESAMGGAFSQLIRMT